MVEVGEVFGGVVVGVEEEEVIGKFMGVFVGGMFEG